jgi:hypothetical protein
MSAATVLIALGLVVAGLGAALALRSCLQAAPTSDPRATAAPIHDVEDLFERAQAAFRATDDALRIGVAMAVVGLLLAGVGAYLSSDARALGADVGGSGTSDRARVGGTW